MLFVIGIYGDAGEIAIFPEGNISLWDDDPSRKERILGVRTCGTQEKLVF
jgi:hypothetical protein